MFKNKVALLSLVVCPLLFSGCADYSGDTYEGRAVGEVSRADAGTIVSIRKIKIKPEGDTPGMGALIGGAGGALAGAAFGGGRGKLLTAGVGGVAGGIAGHMIQNREQDGFEYTVRLDTGPTIVVTQGPSPALSVGQRVNVINSHKGRSRVVPA
ncbi:MAG: glycine zipper 2TM domain-containing protein [Holosporales bacterium]|jgi:outer membrane lipoprotein SlyB|nr:glycine zipper 2TM domain-containing protein [Holosporales bacterium]